MKKANNKKFYNLLIFNLLISLLISVFSVNIFAAGVDDIEIVGGRNDQLTESLSKLKRTFLLNINIFNKKVLILILQTKYVFLMY